MGGRGGELTSAVEFGVLLRMAGQGDGEGVCEDSEARRELRHVGAAELLRHNVRRGRDLQGGRRPLRGAGDQRDGHLSGPPPLPQRRVGRALGAAGRARLVPAPRLPRPAQQLGQRPRPQAAAPGRLRPLGLRRIHPLMRHAPLPPPIAALLSSCTICLPGLPAGVPLSACHLLYCYPKNHWDVSDPCTCNFW